MCGSMGCGPIKRLAKLLGNTVESDCDITIVCGTNSKLQRQLEKKYSGRQNIHVLGFVKNMSVLMDSADLYLTKPGGLSVTEASVKHLPMVYIDAVAGCEEYNRRYFVLMGSAKNGANIKELAAVCLQLLSDDAKRSEMVEILKSQDTANASECIYSALKELQK